MDSTMSGYAIEGTGLGKSFAVGRREVKAFAGIDLRVGHGEFLAILGASGGGKTTLLRVLARLEEHTEGELVMRPRGDDFIAMISKLALPAVWTISRA